MIVSQWRSPVLLVSHHVTLAAPCFHLWVRKTFTARKENASTTKHKWTQCFRLRPSKQVLPLISNSNTRPKSPCRYRNYVPKTNKRATRLRRGKQEASFSKTTKSSLNITPMVIFWRSCFSTSFFLAAITHQNLMSPRESARRNRQGKQQEQSCRTRSLQRYRRQLFSVMSICPDLIGKPVAFSPRLSLDFSTLRR